MPNRTRAVPDHGTADRKDRNCDDRRDHPTKRPPIAPAETNGRFRDDVRDFLSGGPGGVRPLADRLVGSPKN